MAIEMDLKIVGAKNVRRMWDRVTTHYSKDLRPLWEIMRVWWYDTRKKGFQTQGSSLKSMWPELGVLTKYGPPGDYGRWKAKHYPGKPLLVATGAFKRAVTTQGSGSWDKLKKKWMKIGVMGFPGWSTHRWGWTAKNIPQRDYVALSPGNMSALARRIQKHMNKVDKELNREFGGLKTKRGAPFGMAR